MLLGLKRLEALLALRYLASAPGAAEMYLPLPFVSPPVGYRTEELKTILKKLHSKKGKASPRKSLHCPEFSSPVVSVLSLKSISARISQGELTNLEGKWHKA